MPLSCSGFETNTWTRSDSVRTFGQAQGVLKTTVLKQKRCIYRINANACQHSLLHPLRPTATFFTKHNRIPVHNFYPATLPPRRFLRRRQRCDLWRRARLRRGYVRCFGAEGMMGICVWLPGNALRDARQQVALALYGCINK